MDADRMELQVRINGKPVARIIVPRAATKRDLEFAAMSHPRVQGRIGEMTVKGFAVVDGDAVNIVA